jgi:hypothetical protein
MAAVHGWSPVQKWLGSEPLDYYRTKWTVAAIFAGSVVDGHENSNRLRAGAGKLGGSERQLEQQMSNPCA